MGRRSLVGENILGYSVVAEIGGGAFGTVYKAVKSGTLGQYERALKHITVPSDGQYASVLSSMGGDPVKTEEYFSEVLEGVAGEIRLLASLSERRTAHIVRYYESDLEVQESPLRYDVYMLMECATPLTDRLASEPAFRVRDVVRMGLDVLDGIGTCHGSGVIHRDIKEDNIFVSSDGSYEIGDFGVSKALKGTGKAESLKGTPNYLAPEIYLNNGGYTKSVDLYALGMVLYRLLNHGRGPFMPPYPHGYSAEDEDKAFESRMKGLAVPPPSQGGDAVWSVVAKALAGESERYQDAKAFASDLASAMDKTSDEVLDEEVAGVAPAVLRGTEPLLPLEAQPTIRVNLGALGHLAGAAPVDSRPPASMPTVECTDVGKSAGVDVPLHARLDTGEVARSPLSAPARVEKDRSTPHRPNTTFVVAVASGAVALAGAVCALLAHRVSPAVSAISALCSVAGLCTLLFFVGRSIHRGRQASPDAILKGDEPFLLVAQAAADLSAVRCGEDEQAERFECERQLGRLAERMRYEAKFGRSGVEAMACENEIAGELRRLVEAAEAAAGGDNGRLNEVSGLVRRIGFLLDRRRTLARR